MNTKLTLISLLVSASLVGCSGGTSTGASSTIGVITGFGSVYVNGVEYETDTASVSIDGQSGAESDLAVGQVVTLQGSINADGTTGIASSISYADNVEGVVLSTSIAADGTGSLDVMGQTVTVTPETMFDTEVAGIIAMTDIVSGNVVEVSGFSQGDGNIIATHIEVKASSFSGQEMELKGLISGLDIVAETFQMGNLVINYGSATMELEGRVLANGLYVEAKTVSALSGTTMTASKIELESDGDMDLDVDEGEEIKISGPVLEKGSNFIVITGQTIYFTEPLDDDSDISFADISVGMKLEVEVHADAQSRLIAHEVESEEEGDISITAHIAGNGIDMLNKTITIMGQTIQINTSTMFKDERDEGVTPVRYFNIDDLSDGDMLEVDFYMDTAGTLIATRLERDDNDLAVGEFKLEARVESVDASSFSVGGISVELSNYPTARVGEELEVRGSYIDGVMTISSVSLDT